MSENKDTILGLNSRNVEFLTKVILIIAFTAFVGIIVIFLTHTTKLNGSTSIDPSIWGNLGSILGGAVGGLFSIATILLVFLTYRAQKKEMEDTRKVMEGQTKHLQLQQFENTFFKLLDNHTSLLKSLEVSGPVYQELKRLQSDLNDRCEKFNLTLQNRKIVNLKYFYFNPSKDEFFNYELIVKLINDINQISNFIETNNYLIQNEKFFYFDSLYNSLFDSEKYIYGYQAKLKIHHLLNRDAINFSNAFNIYFNNLSDNSKIDPSKEDLWPATIEVKILNGYDYSHSIKDIGRMPPLLRIKNTSDYEIQLDRFKIGDRNYGIDSTIKIKADETHNESLLDFIALEFLDLLNFDTVDLNRKLASIKQIYHTYPISLIIRNKKNMVYNYDFNFYLEMPQNYHHHLKLSLQDIPRS